MEKPQAGCLFVSFASGAWGQLLHSLVFLRTVSNQHKLAKILFLMIFVHDSISRFFFIRHYGFTKIVIFTNSFMRIAFSSVLNEGKYFKQECR